MRIFMEHNGDIYERINNPGFGCKNRCDFSGQCSSENRLKSDVHTLCVEGIRRYEETKYGDRHCAGWRKIT